ncbi:MAG: hypothetical protein A2W98_01895 [Bacteroidetes bacterium GWF2_33_38]|nr:MAG: hypothetical protein A2W98_01895 [Bacteroidetes bacterium GWF2_33_38]OFY75832.1 MAG: hypothetical protein A2265_07965 [Bacteroidetes bacterium RIFOXYA12_FULL_33_9]OFY89462.1 MAG: hypothetical protein A2236_01250 [Bacteroidetes bacterium RIFOXYA2_FULL_33_7]
MKIDKTTYKDRKERLIGMTADHTSRPDKVLFFADPHFLFFFADAQQAHFVFRTFHPDIAIKTKRACFLPTLFNRN